MKFDEIDNSIKFCKILYINLFFFIYLFDYSNFNNWLLLLNRYSKTIYIKGFFLIYLFLDSNKIKRFPDSWFLIPDSRINCFLTTYIYKKKKKHRNSFGWSNFRKWWGWFCICYLLIYIARHYSIYILFIFVSY